MPASEADCPCYDNDDSGCNNLPECSYKLNLQDFCKANQILPDGNDNYNVNNCPGHNVFRYQGIKVQKLIMERYLNIILCVYIKHFISETLIF